MTLTQCNQLHEHNVIMLMKCNYINIIQYNEHNAGTLITLM